LLQNDRSLLTAGPVQEYPGPASYIEADYLKAAPLSSSGTIHEGASPRQPAVVRLITSLPNWGLHFLLWVLSRIIYRIKVLGKENIPRDGGALLVSNHMSFVDVVLISAAANRPIRFLIFRDVYDLPFIKPFAALMRAIPVPNEMRPRDLIAAFRTATEAIRAGELVCVFGEGQITRTGQMLPFRKGMERIIRGVNAPIVPVNLHGLWGSVFSFERERFLWKTPRRMPYPVTISFGKWLPSTASAIDVRHAVQDLHAAAFAADRKPSQTLDRALVRTARRYPRRFCMGDARFPNVSFAGMLLKLIFVTRRLRPLWDNQEMVGILLPPSVGGALVNFAVALLGKVAVNLNYTASTEVLAACATQCNLQTVITSKQFLEKLASVNKIEVPAKSVFLEDVLAGPRTSEKIIALAMALLLPYSLLKRALGGRRRTTDDLATVIFSSGSTGDPKGVMLSHHNVLANIRQMTQVFSFTSEDKIMGILPFFHAFGYTVTLWLTATYGVGVVFHPSPLDALIVGELTRKYRVTFLISTPTFLQAYMRRIPREDFASLRCILVGAEKLSDRVGHAFEEHFGIRPLEGYGCTECSPVVAVNIFDFRGTGVHQVGGRPGTIGQPLPGVTVRIVDPETGKPLPLNTSGMLLVRGPNVMQGYLNRPDKTAEVLNDGWYTTGDIAAEQENGFLTITDRLSRFSKIGGEMVPHIRVEDKLHELAETSDQVFVVSAVRDEKKGERLIVLHTLTDEQLAPTLEKLAASDLPALWKPKKDQFYRVMALPYLGTGKLDLRALKSKALQVAAVPA
jgi:acyl-[acyl-carrier-protein]-phospholipid O-acyltransferase/long-chain-fatty-acid--[acyl-carrier-protein] ligase